MKRLLVVSHAPSPNTRRLTEAVMRGVAGAAAGVVAADCRSPFDAGVEDFRSASAVILGTTENFGYMSGALKDCFDRIYRDCLEHTEGMPYALFVRGGTDGTGARASVERIVGGLRWRPVQEPLVMRGDWQEQWLESVEELGAAMAAGLDAGVF